MPYPVAAVRFHNFVRPPAAQVFNFVTDGGLSDGEDLVDALSAWTSSGLPGFVPANTELLVSESIEPPAAISGEDIDTSVLTKTFNSTNGIFSNDDHTQKTTLYAIHDLTIQSQDSTHGQGKLINLRGDNPNIRVKVGSWWAVNSTDAWAVALLGGGSSGSITVSGGDPQGTTGYDLVHIAGLESDAVWAVDIPLGTISGDDGLGLFPVLSGDWADQDILGKITGTVGAYSNGARCLGMGIILSDTDSPCTVTPDLTELTVTGRCFQTTAAAESQSIIYVGKPSALDAGVVSSGGVRLNVANANSKGNGVRFENTQGEVFIDQLVGQAYSPAYLNNTDGLVEIHLGDVSLSGANSASNFVKWTGLCGHTKINGIGAGPHAKCSSAQTQGFDIGSNGSNGPSQVTMGDEIKLIVTEVPGGSKQAIRVGAGLGAGGASLCFNATEASGVTGSRGLVLATTVPNTVTLEAGSDLSGVDTDVVDGTSGSQFVDNR